MRAPSVARTPKSKEASVSSKCQEMDRAALEQQFSEAQQLIASGDEAGARKALITCAKNGHPSAQFKLGVMYSSGALGLPRNLDQTFNYFLMAADNGNVSAAFNLATCYEKGVGTPSDYNKALLWYQYGADRNHIRSVIALAAHNESKATRDPAFLQQAFELYTKAHKLGDSKSGEIAERLRKRLRSESKTTRAVASSSEWDSEEELPSFNPISRSMPSARPVPSKPTENAAVKPDYLAMGIEAEKASMMEKAAKCYRKAVEENNPKAFSKLGMLYCTGKGVAADELTALRIWTKGAALKDAASFFNLGVAHQRGRGTKIDLKNARDYFVQAQRCGHPEAGRRIELIDSKNAPASAPAAAKPSGPSTQQARQGAPAASSISPAAKAHFEKIKARSARGDPQATLELGKCYLNGNGVPKNPINAVRIIRNATRKATAPPEAHYLMATFYLDGIGTDVDIELAKEHCSQARGFSMTKGLERTLRRYIKDKDGCYYDPSKEAASKTALSAAEILNEREEAEKNASVASFLSPAEALKRRIAASDGARPTLGMTKRTYDKPTKGKSKKPAFKSKFVAPKAAKPIRKKYDTNSVSYSSTRSGSMPLPKPTARPSERTMNLSSLSPAEALRARGYVSSGKPLNIAPTNEPPRPSRLYGKAPAPRAAAVRPAPPSSRKQSPRPTASPRSQASTTSRTQSDWAAVPSSKSVFKGPAVVERSDKMKKWTKDEVECKLDEAVKLSKSLDTAEQTKSYVLLQALAATAHPRALYELGVLFEKGIGVVASDERALEHFLKSAELLYPKALLTVGYAYQQGIGTMMNLKRAALWYFRAHMENDPMGAYLLGECYRRGMGTQKSEKIAITFYQHAASLGNVPARKRLEKLDPAVLFKTANNIIQDDQEDNEKAVKLYMMCIEKKLWKAAPALYRCYTKGIGTAVDANEGVEVLRAAAEAQDPYCAYRLGQLYFHGTNVIKDTTRARGLLEIAIACGIGEAEVLLDQLDAEALDVLGEPAAQEPVAPSSPVSADTHSESKTKEEEVEVKTPLEIGEDLCLDKKFEEAIKYLENSSEIRAKFLLSQCYLRTEGKSRDIKKGIELLTEASDMGVPDAQYNLAVCFEDGIGVEQDYDNAFDLYCLAAENGHMGSQYLIATNYLDGNNVEADDEEAFIWFRRASAQGHVTAMYETGEMYLNGHGTDSNPEAAFEYFSSAAEEGHAMSMFCLYNLYRVGCGVEQDAAKAQEWLQLAADNGQPDAMEIVRSK